MIDRDISRRTLLKGALFGGGLATLGISNLLKLAWAQNNPDVPDRYYVFCYFGGGWDVLLSLDPRDPRQFNNDNLRQTRIQPGYELLADAHRRVREDVTDDAAMVERLGYRVRVFRGSSTNLKVTTCPLYTSDAADDLTRVGRRGRCLTSKQT